MSEFHVGQKVLVDGVNLRGRTHEAEVVKVGRKLVYIEEYGRQIAYRIETGVINDDYGHTWIQTPDQFQEAQDRKVVLDRLRDLGLTAHRFRELSYSTATLKAVCDLLESDL
jgi:hypothetical protein